MNSADRVVDKLQMPKEALDRMVRAVPDEVVRALVGDHIKPAAPSEPNKSLVDRLVEKFGP
jgi:hypothetical protein